MNLSDFKYIKDGHCIITACLELVAFSKADVVTARQGFLNFYEVFRSRFHGELKLYNTAAMKRMKKVDQDALDLVPHWLQKPEQIPPGDFGLDMHSGAASQDAVPPAFEMFCDQTSDQPNSYFRMVLPFDWMEGDSQELLVLTQSALKEFPLLSGYAGYSFFWQTRDIEVMRMAAQYYKPWLKRYPGFVHGETMEFPETALFGIVTPDWLTLLGQEYVKQLGGAEHIALSLGEDIQIHKLDQGLILQAGPQPLIGDVNRNDRLPLYQKVAEFLKEVRAPADEAWIEGFSEDETEAWFARFD